MQIEGTQLISIMSFSMLDFLKFASRMPQMAQILVSSFNIFRTPLEISFFFLVSNSRLCVLHCPRFVLICLCFLFFYWGRGVEGGLMYLYLVSSLMFFFTFLWIVLALVSF